MMYFEAWDKIDFPAEIVKRLADYLRKVGTNIYNWNDYNYIAERILDPMQFAYGESHEEDFDEIMNSAYGYFSQFSNWSDFKVILDVIQEVGM